ncbi:MAG: hypothetical protein ACP5SH_08935 [Syntrophobacteraceae bacterium]
MKRLSFRKICFFSLTAALASSLIAGLAGVSMAQKAVKEPDTITIAWLPNVSADGQAGMRDEIAKVISEATHKKVVNKLTTDYTIAIAANGNI